MTITFYILLGFLNITKQRKSFEIKSLEKKVDVFFTIYTMLWLIIAILTLFTFFISPMLFIPVVITLIWLIVEMFNDKAILVYGKNKEIMQKEFMGVYEEQNKQK